MFLGKKKGLTLIVAETIVYGNKSSTQKNWEI